MERVVLVIAGLDPSGGAGLVADVATAALRGLRAAAVATALTEQDSARCWAANPVAPSLVRAQLARVVADLPIAAVKIGMLGDGAVAQAVAEALDGVRAPIVLDPVLRATAGAVLLNWDVRSALAPLIARAALVTPNRDEAAALTGLAVDGEAGQRAAGERLRAMGAAAALVKGGHLTGAEVVDLLVDGAGTLALRAPRVAATPHGTGCALSTEIACALALGAPLREAVALAHARVAARITAAATVGKGRPFLGR